MGIAKKGDTVKVHYIAKTADKTIFDSKTLVDPLQFTIGKEEIIPAFEIALIGMEKGQKKTVHVESQNAFGSYEKDLISTVNRSELPKDLKLEIGQQLQVQQPDESVVLVTVADLNEKTVTLDANHPLAGKDITFDIQLVEIV
jgi:peptidylprolyl isomerase